jgi:peptidoglycan hydrolase-like protein with peptidoglycan-binding domain
VTGRRVRTRLIVGGLSALVLLLVAAVVATRLRPAPTSAAGPPAPGTATVSRGDLIETLTAPGTLAYGPERAIESRLTGTVTGLAPLASTVERGQELYRVDDRPVVLMYGTLPAYRELTAGRAATAPPGTGTAPPGTGTAPPGTGTAPPGTGTAPPGTGTAPPADAVPATTGADVRQFEENLRALGYSGFTVDDTFTAQTASAVKRWQKDLGMPQTGVVELGRFVVSPGAVRVARHAVVAGAPATGQVLAVTGITRLVTATLEADRQAVAKPAAKVTVVLPSGPEVPGTVESVSTPPDPQGAAAEVPKVSVVVSLGDAAGVPAAADGPVRVRFVVRERIGVLMVPVGALLALAEGGYGLQVIEGGGARIIAVTTGLFANGNVEVSGPEVREGLVVGTAQ